MAVCFSLNTKNGEYQDATDFIPVVAWGPLADRCGRDLKKGSGVLGEGTLRGRRSEARDGAGARKSVV